MSLPRIGFLHPGSMGVSLAASAKNSGSEVYWASTGRSDNTRRRATLNGLQDVKTIHRLIDTCDVIVSICPPHAAETVANQVLKSKFAGIYLDANAISPDRATQIGTRMIEAGVSFVDGSIIGGPAWEPGRTTLYLAGAEAESIASCFSAGPLATRVMGDLIGRASALKMCFAAFSKGTTALLCTVLALAESLNVRSELEEEWDRDGSDFSNQTENRVRMASLKAWRFVGEMEEVEKTLISAGLPAGFHSTAADIFNRLSQFKDHEQFPPLENILQGILGIWQENAE